MEHDPDEQLVDELLENTDPEAKRTFWRSFGGAMKKAAIATGSGTAWLAKSSYENKHYLVCVLNGAIGDRLARTNDNLAIQMSFRQRQMDVSVAALAPLIDAGNGHVVVFVHGLMGNEVMWEQPFGDNEGLSTKLARDHDVVPLYVRYNSGLHISQNGRALSNLLDELVGSYGDSIKRLTLVGHSMGGLVSRSAGHYAQHQRQQWPRLIDTMVLLGAPNDGSYLEKMGHLTSSILKSLFNLHTRIIAGVIDERSAGIKDLRLGLLVDEDWQRPDAGSLRLRERTTVPLMRGVHHRVIVGTLSQSEDSVVSLYFGDGLVGKRSAIGGAMSHEADAAVDYKVFTQTGHVALMTRPEIQVYISECLGSPVTE